MKILYIYKALAVWGGIERIWVDKMNYLASHGYDVYMLTTDQGQHTIPYHLDEHVHYADLGIRFHTPYSLPIYKRYFAIMQLNKRFHDRLKAKLDEIRPDIIISTTELYADTLSELKGNAKWIVECHSNKSHTRLIEGGKFRWLKEGMQKRYFKKMQRADVLVTLSKGDAEQWKSTMKASVIPNVVHLNESGQYSSCDNKRVIFAGRFAQQKGINYLIEIWKKVHQQHPDWQLDMYGEGEDKQYYKSLIESHPDHLGINLYAPSANIFEKYRESSIFLITSVYEPFGLVIPEAMSCGLPVVSFRSPYGPESIIDNGQSGYLIDCFDTTAFAKKVCRLIEDAELRKKMGSTAAQCSNRFSAERIMPMWQQLFDELLARK